MGFPCTYPGCGAILKFKNNYNLHMRKHQGIYPYHCPYCNKGLGATQLVKRHLMTSHTGLLGFHCITCKQEFQNVLQLTLHLQQNSCTMDKSNDTVDCS